MPAPIHQMRVCLIICIFCLAFNSYAQDSTIYYKASVTAAVATGQTPFWEHANQNGNIPMAGNFALANLALYKVYNPHNPRTFQWSGGIQGIGSYGKKESLFLSDIYLAAKIGPVEILAGQKNMVTGLMDTTFTSGSMSVSGNARPIPRIQISTPDYLPLYFLGDGFLSVKFSYSDGFLGSSQLNYGTEKEVSYTYFHQKSLYLRLGKRTQRFKVYAGMNHQAIWGGEDKIIPLYEFDPLKAYWYTIAGKTIGYRKVGNHFGTIDVGGEWRGRKLSYFIYRQNIYETGSLFKVTNFQDGLNGIRIKRVIPVPKGSSYLAFHSFLFEVLGTQNQVNSSPLSGLVIFEKGNYYNSYLYRRGWSYFGNGIGTPVIPPSRNTREELPRSDYEFTNNNRLWAFHTGVSATWLHMKFGFRGTYSRNSGSYVSAYNEVKQQVSVMLDAEKDIKFFRGCSVYSSISSDIGDLYPNSYGLLIGIRKSGFLDR